jgi:beta-glucanase (GH16 family)
VPPDPSSAASRGAQALGRHAVSCRHRPCRPWLASCPGEPISHVKPAVFAALGLLCLVIGALWVAGVDEPNPSRRTPAPSGTPTSTAPSTGSSTAPSTADRASAAVRYGWGPVLAGDEFDYTGAPKVSKWSVYDGAGNAGQGRRSPDAWHVDGSVATVTGDSQGTTGGMAARFGKQKFGRWETRMRTSARDSEYHPVLILWPDAASPVRCSEVDYAEGNEDTTRIKSFLHYSCAPRQTSASRLVDTTRWHTYAVEWAPGHITSYIDGRPFFTDTDPAHFPRRSMHQTVQLDWFPDGSSTKASTMSFDWVRVYAPR